MARLLSEDLPSTAPWSERRVYEALAALGDSWTVLWNVPVGVFGTPRPGLRQIDFLLLHERIGAIVLEVKGGEISVEDGRWYTRPHASGRLKALDRSPFEQVADQRYTLQRYLADRMSWRSRDFGHAVCFPASVVGDEGLGPDAPRDLILDVNDLKQPGAAVSRVARAWGMDRQHSHADVDGTVSLLRPSGRLRIVMAHAAEKTLGGLERETRRQVDMVQSQVEVYRELLRTSRACVVGGAGTGKTVIACERARQLRDVGARTLLLCHRSVVRSFMATVLDLPHADRQFDPDGGKLLQVVHWPALLNGLAARTESPAPTMDSQSALEWFLAARESLPAPYDAIVVDEGQEFTSRHFEALEWLLDDPDTSPMYVFADPFQHSGLLSTPSAEDRRNLAGRYRWSSPLGEAAILPLTINCRNSAEIADVAYGFYPFDAPKAIVHGLQPQFIRAREQQEITKRTLQEAVRLVADEGFSRNQILLVFSGIPHDLVLRHAGKLGVELAFAEQLYRFPLTPRDVRFVMGPPDAVQGLEADVVVVGLWSKKELGIGELRDAYIAASRARSVLIAVSPYDEGALRSMALSVIDASQDPYEADADDQQVAHQRGETR
jgi:hypothetical protein